MRKSLVVTLEEDDVTPEQQNLARAYMDEKGEIYVRFRGPFKIEPDLVVGTVDDEGVFHPSKEEYRTLESWLREQERLYVEEQEEETFGLNDLVVTKSMLRFAYGPDWQDLWGWDDDEGVWFRKG